VIVVWVVCVTRAANIIYSKGYTAFPSGDITLGYTTLTITIRSTGCRAAGTVAPVATDRGIGYRVMIGIMESDCYRRCPPA